MPGVAATCRSTAARPWRIAGWRSGRPSKRARGEIEIPPPTFVTLVKVGTFPDARSALEAGRSQDVIHYLPRVRPVEGDVAYEDGDPEQPGPRRRMYRVASGWRYEDDV